MPLLGYYGHDPDVILYILFDNHADLFLFLDFWGGVYLSLAPTPHPLAFSQRPTMPNGFGALAFSDSDDSDSTDEDGDLAVSSLPPDHPLAESLVPAPSLSPSADESQIMEMGFDHSEASAALVSTSALRGQ